jgi:regulator of protease activity HflC (stomatin/prohibitin superfamily)
MTLNEDALLFTGFLVGVLALPIAALFFELGRVDVNEGEVVLVLRFGRLVAMLDRPGYHFLPDKVMPWTEIRRVSTRREFRNISGVHVNDARGTTVVVDVFLEFRIVFPEKATFAVADWERALTSVVSHAVTSTLGNRNFEAILSDRSSLADAVRAEIADETSRWGLKFERLMIRNVALLPEVSHKMMRSVAAGIERWKADIEEDGRQRVSMLEARTTAEIANHIAGARAQYPAAIGRAFARLKDKPRILGAYNELYELSLLHPQRTIAFVGFKDGEIRPVDAAMLVPLNDGAPALPPRST